MCKFRGLDIEIGKSGADPDFGKFGPIWDWIKFAHIDLSEITLLQGQVFKLCTGRERLIRSHSSARFSFELSGNSN